MEGIGPWDVAKGAGMGYHSSLPEVQPTGQYVELHHGDSHGPDVPDSRSFLRNKYYVEAHAVRATVILAARVLS